MIRRTAPGSLYIAAVCLAGAACLVSSVLHHPFRPTLETGVLAGLAVLFATRVIRIVDRVYLSPSHPFIFAVLLLQGPTAGMLVAGMTVLTAALLKKRRMRLHQVLFNLSAATLCIGFCWVVYDALAPHGAGASLEQVTAPVLFTSFVFYMLNSGFVAVAMSLTTGVPLVATWRDNALWSGPSFLVGGVVGMLMARSFSVVRSASLLLTLPFCYLIYSTYRLYMDRMHERKARLESTEELNHALESRVGELDCLNQQLHVSTQRHAQTSRLKSEFLATLSHELRTPLNAILGFSEMLLHTVGPKLGGREVQALREIHQSGQSLLALISDLLDLSRIEAGRLELRPERCAPAGIVEETLAMVRMLAERKGIVLETSLERTAPIEADPFRLRQILWNLLTNAIKFTPAGGRVGATLREQAEGICLTVWDTGIGIPADQLDRIFDEFYQIDGSLARSHEGTGLGLALVKRFVSLHGGRIEVRSEPQRGSSFVITLPRRLASEPASPQAAERPAAGPASREAPSPSVAAVG